VTENWIKWCRKWQNSLQVAWKVNISLLVITFVQTFGDFVMVKALNIENFPRITVVRLAVSNDGPEDFSTHRSL